MRSAWLVVMALLVACVLLPARAAGRVVALVPAYVTNGPEENGDVMTDALREELEANGFEVLPEREVRSALRTQRMNLARPQTVRTLGALRRSLRADYVVYPRVLSVGIGVNSERVQANVLVNVLGPSRDAFIHTRQLGQLLGPRAARSTQPVIADSTAESAASKLLEGFFTRVR